MTVHVACFTCRKTFEASAHAGRVRCAPCEDAHAFRFPGLGPRRVVL